MRNFQNREVYHQTEIYPNKNTWKPAVVTLVFKGNAIISWGIRTTQ